MPRLRRTAKRLPELASGLGTVRFLGALTAGFAEFRFRRLARPGTRSWWIGRGERRRRVTVRRNGIDTFTFYEVFIKGVYDGLLPLRSDDTVLDLGANIGLAAAYFDFTCPSIRVIAVEPERANAVLCRSNAPGATLVEAAVASEDGEAALDVRDPTSHRLGPGGVLVKTVSLETLAMLEGAVTVVKCDVEGAEREILARPSPMLDQVRAVAIEVHGPELLEVVDRAFARHGLVRVGSNSPLPELYERRELM